MAAGANGSGPNVIQRVMEIFSPRAMVRELIGRYVMGNANLFRSRLRVKTVDETRPDYEFWDKLRRGKASGYSLGGLFAKRIERIFASWVIGQDLTVTLADSGDPDNPDDPRNHTDGQLARFLSDNYTALLDAKKDSLGLGDQFVVVNPDGTLSVPSPDTVEPERDPLDYRRLTAVTITNRLGKYTVIDRYEPDRRTLTIKDGATVESEQTFANLIGRIPVVHIAHGRSANEVFGHPVHEPLLPLYDQYDDLIYKQLDGAKLLGNPLLAFVGLEDLTEVINANDPAEQDTYTDKDGNTATRHQLNIDQNAVLLVGKGGDAKFVAPPTGFTEDTKTALKSLFLLLLDHTGIPEFIWGNEMSSSRSSAETPLKQWTMDVVAQRKHDERWLLDLCTIWLQTVALIDRRVVVDDLTVRWPALLDEDKEILLKFIQFASDRGLLTDKTALALTELVEDAATEVQKAQAEAEERQERMFPDGSTAAFQGRLGQDAEEAGE